MLMDELGRVIGSQPKRVTHHAHTPLHLGFSCYVVNPTGHLLLTRRAVNKRSFGGVWTNTVCGHPAPGEAAVDAVIRRASYELGMTLRGVAEALPDFRYRAEQGGVVENEWCPVFIASSNDEPTHHPDEVAESRWSTWAEFLAETRRRPAVWSPWCREQAEQLDRDGMFVDIAGRLRAG